MNDALIRLNAEYAAAIDDDRLEEWPRFFTEDCFYCITTADNHRRGLSAGLVYADSRAMLDDRVSSLRRANIYEAQRYRHLVGLPRIVGEDDGGVARAETGFAVIRIMRGGDTTVFASGRYLDRVVLREGAVKLASRLVVCDSPRVDTLLALPL